MKRTQIRDSRNSQRVMDVIVDDNGEKLIEVKDGRNKKTILFDDFEKQINNMK